LKRNLSVSVCSRDHSPCHSLPSFLFHFQKVRIKIFWPSNGACLSLVKFLIKIALTDPLVLVEHEACGFSL
ncbi:unnamed protein product, partial [Amoebophrya sp. A25]